jgi:hypothetical protein
MKDKASPPESITMFIAFAMLLGLVVTGNALTAAYWNQYGFTDVLFVVGIWLVLHFVYVALGDDEAETKRSNLK